MVLRKVFIHIKVLICGLTKRFWPDSSQNEKSVKVTYFLAHIKKGFDSAKMVANVLRHKNAYRSLPFHYVEYVNLLKCN